MNWVHISYKFKV